MPTFEKSEDWYKQSVLLLQARPSTTRVTTKYKIVKCKPAKPSKKAKSTQDATKAEVPTEYPPSAILKLKTYDPVSGACLQYKTRQAAEVGRLIASLGKLGKAMAALPAEELDENIDGPSKVEEAEDVAMKDASTETPSTTTQQQGGGGKKKKKGKK